MRLAAIAADVHALNICNSIKQHIFIQTDVQACRCGSKPAALAVMPKEASHEQ